jgi:transposase-like protein
VKIAVRSRTSLLSQPAFTRFRFPAEVIVLAVRWNLCYGLSFRDVEELLAERGVQVDHVTVYRWVQRFTPLFADAARFARHSPGDRWFVDETYVKVNCVCRYVYRAVDQHGQVIDALVSPPRDGDAAHRFFCHALTTLKVTLTEVVIDARLESRDGESAALRAQCNNASRCAERPADSPMRLVEALARYALRRDDDADHRRRATRQLTAELAALRLASIYDRPITPATIGKWAPPRPRPPHGHPRPRRDLLDGRVADLRGHALPR